MSKKEQKKAARKAVKVARKAAKRAAELQAAPAPAAKPSLAVRVNEFMIRHAPSKTDMRWYRSQILLVAIVTGLASLAHKGGLM